MRGEAITYFLMGHEGIDEVEWVLWKKKRQYAAGPRRVGVADKVVVDECCVVELRRTTTRKYTIKRCRRSTHNKEGVLGVVP